MLSLARIAALACFGAIVAAIAWGMDRRFNTFGPLNLADVSLGIVIVSGAVFFGCFEAWRVFVERHNAGLNRAVAVELGCEYFDDGPWKEFHSWSSFVLFRNKESPCASHRMLGNHGGREVDVFDYEYRVTSSTTNGSTTSTYTQTVYRFPEAALGLRRFFIQPRRRLTGLLSGLIGATEVELSPPETATSEMISAFVRFRKRYQITVAEESATLVDWQRLLHPFVVSWLSMHPGWSIESNGTDLVAWQSHATQVGVERRRMLDQLGDLLTLMTAADAAAAETKPSQVALRPNNLASAIAGLIGLWLGVMLGMFFGGMLGMGLMSVAFAGLPAQIPDFPVETVVFFSSSAAVALLGGYLGMRWAHNIGQRIAPRLSTDPKPQTEAVHAGEQPTVAKMETDLRVMIWFFSWLAGFGVCSAGFVLLTLTVPAAMRFVGEHPWLIVVCVAAAMICMAFATSPWYLGIHCKRCRQKLRKMKTDCDLKTGNTPLQFYCKTCDVVWQTHLISGPGSPSTTISH